jgi:hypothetical protein
VLGIGAEGVGALLARARLRLHDELHGTALAATAVRSPDCEDVVPLLAAGADGELDRADAAWADPHLERCATCPRTRRAMHETAATYAAWSPAVPPAWLGAATLAELHAGSPASGAPAAPGRPRREAGGTWSTPRPRLSVALVGATLLGVASAALALTTTGSLRQGDPAGGVRLPDAARSLRVARVPAKLSPRGTAERRTSHRPRRARPSRRARRVAYVPVRAVRHAPSAPQPAATRRPAVRRTQRPASRPKRRPARRPAPASPAPAPAAPASASAPAPVTADAPADELPGASSSPTAAVSAGAAQVPTTTTPPKTTTTAPPAPAPTPTPPAAGAAAAPIANPAGHEHHDGGGWRRSRNPCPPRPRCQRRSCRG